jgi:hypothetical protein
MGDLRGVGRRKRLQKVRRPAIDPPRFDYRQWCRRPLGNVALDCVVGGSWTTNDTNDTNEAGYAGLGDRIYRAGG